MRMLHKNYHYLVLLLLLGVFFILSTHAISEGDTFWHLKNGQYIWQHKSLPDADPFGLTGEIDPWKQITLRGFWLSQLIYYFVFSIGNTAGIILLRASIITGILIFLYWWMRKSGVRFHLTIPFLFLVGFNLKGIGDRPQIFSFLLFVLTAFCLEQLRTDESRQFRKQFLALPALMLLWPNLHGAFVMGLALIACYSIGEMLRYWKDSKQSYFVWRNAIIYAASVGMTFCNPNLHYWHIYAWNLRNDYHTAFVMEYNSPAKAFLLGDLNLSFWALLITAAILIAFRLKHIPIAKTISLIFVGLFSLKMQRVTTFFIMLTPLTVSELSLWIDNKMHMFYKYVSFVFIILSLYMIRIDKDKFFDFYNLNEFPVNAVKFINAEKPSGRLFSYSDWGGYLMIFAPDYKIFQDNRFLCNDLFFIHNKILTGENWEKFLMAGKFDIILIPTKMPESTNPFPLESELNNSNQWRLVYRDYLALIYLRKGSANDRILPNY